MAQQHGKPASGHLRPWSLVLCLFFAVLCGSLRVRAADSQTVRVAYVVMESFEEGEEGELKSGYGYEYLQRIAYYTGWEYEYVYGGFKESLARLAAGEVDLMARVAYTEERTAQFYFSAEEQGEETYYLVARVGETRIDTGDLSTLSGMKVGVTEGRYSADLARQWLEENQLDCQVVEFATTEERNDALNRSDIDVIVASEIYMQDTWTPLLKIRESAYYFGVSKDRPDLLEQLDQAMADIRSVNPFFNEDLKTQYNNLISVNSGSLTAAETAWIAETRPIRIGYLEDYYPYSGTNSETGEVDGLLADFLTYLSEKYGLQFKATAYANDVALNQAFQDGQVDMAFPICGDSDLGERAGIMITDALTQSTMVMLSCQRDTEAFRTLAVTQNDPFQMEYAERYYADTELLLCDTLRDCVEAVRTGQADFTFVETAKFNEQESTFRYASLNKLDLQQFMKISFAVQKGQTTLYSILNKGIISMDDTAISGAMLHHLRQNTNVTVADFLRQHILAALLTVVVIFALICILLVAHFTSNAKRKKELTIAQNEAEEAQWDATHDSLTGLCNRSYFQAVCGQLAKSQKPLAVLILDVDQFKLINDQYGHEMGDDALRKVARLLKLYFRGEDHVIRYAGDEFVVIMENITTKEQTVIDTKIQRINYRLQHPDDSIPSMTLSVGVVFSTHGYVDGMLNQADKALYRTKANGRCGYTVYS